MSGDNKNEQSVMIPLDELLAQDPSLGSVQQKSTLQTSDVNQKKLERVGIGMQNAGAPMNSVVVPARRAEIKTKNFSNKLLSIVAIVIGIVALVAVGIYIGSLNTQSGPKLTATNTTPTTTQNSTTQTPQQTPQQTPEVATANQTEENQDTEETQNTEENQPAVEKQNTTTVSKTSKKTRTRSKRRPTKRQVTKTQTAQVETAPPPPPPPVAEKPKASEASQLLGNIGKKTKNTATETPETTKKNSSLPDKLERAQILSTLRKNQRAVATCKTLVSSPTRTKVRVVVSGNGSVSDVSLIEPANLKGSPVEKCLSERIKLFKFPQFNDSSMSIKLPFNLG